MNIFLFGYRAAGKTSVGRQIAQETRMIFIDTDVETQLRYFDGATITEVFKNHGEQSWREAEVAVTKDACHRDDQVIALGGGTLMQPGARKAIENVTGARRIYLACNAQELYRRIQLDPDSSHSRPNLTGLGGGLKEIEAVLADRDPVFRQAADIVVDVSDLTVDEVVHYLVTKVLSKR